MTWILFLKREFNCVPYKISRTAARARESHSGFDSLRVNKIEITDWALERLFICDTRPLANGKQLVKIHSIHILLLCARAPSD